MIFGQQFHLGESIWVYTVMWNTDLHCITVLKIVIWELSSGLSQSGKISGK